MIRTAVFLMVASSLLLLGISSGDAGPVQRPAPSGRVPEPLPSVMDAPQSPAGELAVADATVKANRQIAGPADAATDPEWLELPRSQRDVVARALQTRRCDPVQLYRSHAFNPRDRWLSPVQRAEIEVLTDLAHARIERIRQEMSIVQALEFAAAHVAGKTLPADITTLEGQANLRRIGAAPVFAEIHGESFAVALAELPRTSAADAALLAEAQASCMDLARVFAAHGALDQRELDALTATILGQRH